MTQNSASDRDQLPALPFDSWKDTLATLHMWTQIVGKVRLRLCPLVNHWWNVPFYVTARGLTTSAMPYPQGAVVGTIPGAIEVRFDFIAHQLMIETSEGRIVTIALQPQSVAEFYQKFMAALADLGIACKIWTRPSEIAEPIPFEQDHLHAAYDPDAAYKFWRILVWSDQILKEFRTRFLGKVSPVHFFWGEASILRSLASRAEGHPSGREPTPSPAKDTRTK